MKVVGKKKIYATDGEILSDGLQFTIEAYSIEFQKINQVTCKVRVVATDSIWMLDLDEIIGVYNS